MKVYDPKVFIEYSNVMDDTFKHIAEYIQIKKVKY